MLTHAVESDALRGPFNAVAPEPIRQGEFAKRLGRVLRRPALIPAPEFALRIVLGRDRANELLLASARVRPGVLERAGYRHRDPELEPYLARILAPRAGGGR